MSIPEWKNLRQTALLLKIDAQDIDVSVNLLNALIAAEDRRFNYHSGVDIRSLSRALWRIVFFQKIEGGSTIAMQLVRVLTGNYQKTISRKLKEIVYAVCLTKIIGKNDLPKMYLLVAYFGWKMNGLKQAAIRLNFDPSNVCELKSSELIARLKYPEPKNANKERLEKIKVRSLHIQKCIYDSPKTSEKPYGTIQSPQRDCEHNQ